MTDSPRCAAGRSEAILLVASALSAVGTFAFKNDIYRVYVLFLTAVLILVQALLGADSGAAASDRLLALILGVALASIGIAIGRFVVSPADRRQRSG